MQENQYWEIRDKVVNELDTKNTINLVIDLLGNLADLQEEVTQLNPNLKEDYKRLIEQLNLLTWG